MKKRNNQKIIYLKGNVFQQVKFIGKYKQKGNLTHIYWDKCLLKDIIEVPHKLFGLIPWSKKEVGWVRGDRRDTPNPYIIPTNQISLIENI